jgi:hypothetical protein
VTSFFGSRESLVWVTNGTAEEMERGWVRILEASGAEATEEGSALGRYLRDKIAYGGPGIYGFSIDEDEFRPASVRRLCAQLIAELAHEMAMAVAGSPGDESLAFLATHTPYFKAYWLEAQERLHAIVAASLDEGVEPLVLPIDSTTRAAMEVLTLRHAIDREVRARAQASSKGPVDFTRELALRRRQRDAFLRAVDLRWPGASPLEPLYRLAELEASLRLFTDAAGTVEACVSMEDGPQGIARARELARHYREKAGT